VVDVGLYEVIKNAVTIAQKTENIELYRTILDIQKEAQDLQQKNIELLDENKQLKEKLTFKQDLEFDNEKSIYWMNNINGKQDGPFCSRCYDSNDKLVHLHKITTGYFCPACGRSIGYINDNFK
jgi:hypothetical protein